MSCSFQRKKHWLCLSILALVAATSGARAQNSVNVTATASSVSPDWEPAPMLQSDPPATASLNASIPSMPTPPYNCTLNPPTWEWGYGASNVQYSADNITWTSAPANGYSTMIVQPSRSSSSATLQVWYLIGGYWKFPCTVQVNIGDAPCGDYWFGTAVAVADGKSVQLTNLTVIVGATQTNVTGATNWADVVLPGAIAIAQATTVPDNEDAWAQILWTGGSEGASANQRNVDKSTSAKTTVTAQIGTVITSVNIWVLWVTITNKITGTTPPNAVQFGMLYDGTENLGAIAYKDATFGRTAVGKIVPIGLITPVGVHDVVKAGWTFKRDAWSHDFADGAQASIYDTNWVDDTSNANYQVLTPDANDQIYDRDAPDVFQAFGAKDSVEVYSNFREYVQWNGIMASDYQGWYWKGWWKVDGNPDQITLKQIGQGSITLPNTPNYPPPK